MLPGVPLRLDPAVHPYTLDGLELSLAARRRLGIAPGQKNVLVRLVIRDLDRTLTSAAANELRDAVYAVLHQGSVSTWAAKEMQL
jgi:phenylalanyl-tRNA synthetase alpha chain